MSRVSDPQSIVITGTGCICAAGHDPESVWTAVRAGRSSVAPIRRWDSSGWPHAVGGEVTEDARGLLGDRKLARLIGRADAFGLFAAAQAIDAAGCGTPALSEREREAVGVFVGAPGGSLESSNDFLVPLAVCGGDMSRFGAAIEAEVNPLWGLTNLPNNVLCHIGIRHGFKGPNACFVHHNVGGALALDEALAALRAGTAERALAVAYDAPIEPRALLYYEQIGLLGDALIPYTVGREGTVLGDGAGALLLETRDGAARRGAQPLAEVLAVASTCEATGALPLRPDGDGLARAIRLALAEAGLEATEVGVIVAHANGTPTSDASEVSALRSVFGAAMPPVTGFKWAFGHTLVAASLIEAVLAVALLRDRVVPGVPVLGAVDTDCNGVAIRRAERPLHGNVALVLARGFGGTNAALLLRRAGEP